METLVKSWRAASRQLRQAASEAADPDERRELAERALDFAQQAEALERGRLSVVPADPARQAAEKTERARQWRLRAEEYRRVAEQLRTDRARRAYRTLAETYDRLASGAEPGPAGPVDAAPKAG